MCEEAGLSECTASEPAEEVCNGIDDDCNGLIDEVDCDDGNECTKDICGGESGCAYEALNGDECLDGDICTVADHCEEGVCVGQALNCDDDNPCTEDACQPYTGECISLPNLDGGCCEKDEDCDDGLSCTTDTCGPGGVCSNLGGPCAEQIRQWGEKGDEDGELKFPGAIAVLLSGEVVISDTQNNRLSVFSREGEFSRHFDAALPEKEGCLTVGGDGSCSLSAPSGLDVFKDGRLVVADTGNDRLIIYKRVRTCQRIL